LAEPVRLVVWDLDETLWRGTLTEGGIEIIPANFALIRTLAERGIVSSICSRNDLGAVERILSEAGIWDYFVLPSVNWEAKGPRLRALIESLQLRPASAMFIDDNHLNLKAALHELPDLQVSDPSIIPRIATLPLFDGKADPDLGRLRQYKLLEQRKTDEQAADGDTSAFLRSCNIVVEIEHDITPHLDRAIELINRTNQLNFIKSRLPEDPHQATQELTTLLARHEIQAGLVRVVDRYGDHGYCGIYILRMPRRLLQFAFSCRILGMGVERWLYERLGRPHLAVQGEVLSDVVHDVSPIDWIQFRSSASSVNESAAEQKGWISARGGCDLRAVGHYFSLGAFRSSGEYNFNRHGCDVRIDHSMFLRYAIAGLPPGGMDACKLLGYCEEDFRTALLDQRPGMAVWLLSFWSDTAYAIYRHRETGVVVPFMFPKWHQATDVRKASLDDLPAEQDRSRYVDPLAHLKENFDYMGLISKALFKENLKIILDAAPLNTRVFILGANEHLWDSQASVRHRHSGNKSLNRWTRAVTRWRRKVTILNIRDFVASDTEVHNWGHFDRTVYFRIYQEIERRMLR
jgi:FkbH-like protein